MIERFGTVEPEVIVADHGVSIMGYKPRIFPLTHGDTFVSNNVVVQQVFNLPIRKIKLGEIMNEHFICTKKIKRKHWWQFWKPKYVAAKFIYVEKENVK